MGNKTQAKEILSENEPSIPLIPGYRGEDQSLSRLIEESTKIGKKKKILNKKNLK